MDQATTLNTLSAVSAGLTSIFQGTSQLNNARATQISGDWQAQQYDLNKKLLDLQSTDERANFDIERQLERAAQTEGGQMAQQSSMGVDVNSKTAQAIRAETSAIGAKDAMTIRNNAYKRAFGYEVESLNEENKARLAKIANTAEVNASKAAANSAFAGGALRVISDLDSY